MRAFRFLLHKEFLQIFRDRVIVGMLFVMPMVQLVVLANAATFEVSSAQLYVVDNDHSGMSRGVVERLSASGRFVAVAGYPSLARANEAMLRRDIDVILVIPEGLARGLVRFGRASVQLVFNAENGAAAGVTLSYATRILDRYSRALGRMRVPMTTTAESGDAAHPLNGYPMIAVQQRGWYNADLRYRDYMIPAILVIVVTMVGTLLTAMNIVREKESGTLEQLNVTPISRSTFIAAKLIPLWSLALLDLAIGLGLAWLVFDLPIRGSLALVFVAAAVYLIGALGIGVWISSISRTQQQAMFVTFSILMVYLLMSGLFTPVRGMPEWAQWIAQASPIMHFTQLMRAVLLKGAGLTDVLYELSMLGGIGALVMTVAVRQYSKRAA